FRAVVVQLETEFLRMERVMASVCVSTFVATKYFAVDPSGITDRPMAASNCLVSDQSVVLAANTANRVYHYVLTPVIQGGDLNHAGIP
ncbi:MAG: hypothetical protein WCI73_08625, partial [Phycisphaerae bacterium]